MRRKKLQRKLVRLYVRLVLACSIGQIQAKCPHLTDYNGLEFDHTSHKLSVSKKTGIYVVSCNAESHEPVCQNPQKCSGSEKAGQFVCNKKERRWETKDGISNPSDLSASLPRCQPLPCPAGAKTKIAKPKATAIGEKGSNSYNLKFASTKHAANLNKGWTFVLTFGKGGLKSGYVKSKTGENLSVSPSGAMVSFTNRKGDEDLTTKKSFEHELEFYWA